MSGPDIAMLHHGGGGGRRTWRIGSSTLPTGSLSVQASDLAATLAQYRERRLALACRMLASMADAEDAVQETYLDMLSNVSPVRLPQVVATDPAARPSFTGPRENCGK